MELEIVVYSDNSMIEQVANILHDHGYRTAGIRKEFIGKQEKQEMKHDIGKEKEINVVMNIGLTTQDGKELNMDTVINMIGLFADCTITPTIGFYKGKRENSLKVEIYGYKATAAFTLAAHFARSFNQECVALTANGYTAFISQQPTNDEYKEFVARVDK